MAYDEGLAQRVREVLADRKDLEEKRMFGGLAFLLSGHMCVGVLGEELMVRVGPEAYEKSVRLPHARKMDFTGRPMKGFVYVAEKGIAVDRELKRWIARGVAFVSALPAK